MGPLILAFLCSLLPNTGMLSDTQLRAMVKALAVGLLEYVDPCTQHSQGQDTRVCMLKLRLILVSFFVTAACRLSGRDTG